MPFSPKLARFVRRALLTLAVLATLVVALIVVENWRGERAWREYAARCAAAGDPVDRIPAPSALTSDRNFMQTPVLRRWLYAEKGDPELKRCMELTAPNTVVRFEWRDGRSVDFAKYFAAQQAERKEGRLPESDPAATPVQSVLTSLAPLEAELSELRQAAAARPESEFVRSVPLRTEEPFIGSDPRFEVTQLLSTSLAVHACAQLAEGRNGEAFADTLAGLKFSRGLIERPDGNIFETLVGGAALSVALQPVWEGATHHAWSEVQLAQVQGELAQVRLLAAFERSLGVERALIVQVIDRIPGRFVLSLRSVFDEGWIKWVVLPRGWADRNKIAICEGAAARIAVLQARGTSDFLPRHAAADQPTETSVSKLAPYRLLAAAASSNLGRIATGVTAEDAMVTLAFTACALERYRLAHGGYPETLAELAPAFVNAVPLDVIDGQPLRYRRLADGTFKLYSIGMNGKDDDGTPSDWKTDEGRRSGDWCWPQPAK